LKTATLIPPDAEVIRAGGQSLQDGHDMHAALGFLLVDYLQTERGGMQNGAAIAGIQQLHYSIGAKLQSGLRKLSPMRAGVAGTNRIGWNESCRRTRDV